MQYTTDSRQRTDIAHSFMDCFRDFDHMIAMRKESERPKTWRYTTTLDDQVRFLLAPNLEHAAWAAAELSGGSCNVKNIILDDYEW